MTKRELLSIMAAIILASPEDSTGKHTPASAVDAAEEILHVINEEPRA